MNTFIRSTVQVASGTSLLPLVAAPGSGVTHPDGPGGAVRLFLCTEDITCVPDCSFLMSLDCRGPQSSPAPRSQRHRHQRHRRRSCPPRSPQHFHSIRSEWWTVRSMWFRAAVAPGAVPGKGLWAVQPEGLGSSSLPPRQPLIPVQGTSSEMG